MSNRHPTIGGKGKRAVDKPPKPFYESVRCPVCARLHTLALTYGTSMVVAPCECGVMVRWHLRSDVVTVETVEPEP